MLYALSEEERLLEDSAGGFLGDVQDEPRRRAFREAATGFDAGFWAKMAELGWLGLRLPESLGGSGLDVAAAAAVARKLGQGAVADPYVGACLTASVVLAEADGAPAAARLAEALAVGATPIVLGAGEQTLAVEGSRLTGQLSLEAWAPGCAALLLIRHEGQPAIAAIEADAPGVTATPLARIDGSLGAELSLAGVALAEDAVLLTGPAALAAWRRAQQEGLMALSAQLTGLGRGLLDITTAYLEQRVQFGQPIADFQAIQHKVVDLTIALQLAESAHRAALRAYQADPETAAAAIHAAKARCSDMAMDIARASIQLHGAIGYTDECSVGSYVKSAMTLSQAMGGATQHRAAHWRLVSTQEPAFV